MMSMDNPEYHVVAGRGLLHGSLAAPLSTGPASGSSHHSGGGYGPGYGPPSDGAGPGYGTAASRPNTHGLPEVAPAPFGGSPPNSGVYAPTAGGGGGAYCSAPPTTAYPAVASHAGGAFATSAPPSVAYPSATGPSSHTSGVFATSAPPSGTFAAPVYSVSSPNSVGVPVAEGVASSRWAGPRHSGSDEPGYDYYGSQAGGYEDRGGPVYEDRGVVQETPGSPASCRNETTV